MKPLLGERYKPSNELYNHYTIGSYGQHHRMISLIVCAALRADCLVSWLATGLRLRLIVCCPPGRSFTQKNSKGSNVTSIRRRMALFNDDFREQLLKINTQSSDHFHLKLSPNIKYKWLKISMTHSLSLTACRRTIQKASQLRLRQAQSDRV